VDHTQELINQLIAGPVESQLGLLANELLREFQHGYPLQHLRPLLLSADDYVAETGIWVASELGQQARPLLGEITRLLHHPVKAVRFFAIDAILSSATEANKHEVALVIPLIDDAEAAVRWKAMEFLARASSAQLQPALDYLRATEPDSGHVDGLGWLLSASAGDADQIESYLADLDAGRRKYGAVAAARMAAYNRGPLVHATSMDEPDIKQFAVDMLKRG
jgi:hypothetical protein